MVDHGTQPQFHAVALDQFGDDLFQTGAVLSGARVGVSGSHLLGLPGDHGVQAGEDVGKAAHFRSP